MEDHAPQIREVTLVFERETDPISGCCREGRAPEKRFVGWLSLMAILEPQRRDGEDERRADSASK